MSTVTATTAADEMNEARFKMFDTVYTNGLGFQPIKIVNQTHADVPFWLVLMRTNGNYTNLEARVQEACPNVTTCVYDFIGYEFVLLSVNDYELRWQVITQLYQAGVRGAIWTKHLQVYPAQADLLMPLDQLKWETYVWQLVHNDKAFDTFTQYVIEHSPELKTCRFPYAFWDDMVASGVVDAAKAKAVAQAELCEFDYTQWSKYQSVNWKTMTFNDVSV